MQAGPWGSALGLIVGAIVMVIMARNYHYLINRFPTSGGAYDFTKRVFGYDHAFLVSWFLALTYIAMFWANDTSLPLFARYFMGDAFQFGMSYGVFGYEVYLGEVMLCLAGIVITALLCTRFRKIVAYLVSALAIIFTLCITACFIAVALGFGGNFASIEPGFIPNQSAVSQILLIACISPWAFIGFENLSHHTEEFAFPTKLVFRIMLASIGTALLLYCFILLMSTTAFPSQYSNWFEYIADLSNLTGIEGLPAFYAANHYMGTVGVALLMLTLLALVVTSLFGNLVALSRLLHAMAKDDILPSRFAVINKYFIPGRCVILIAAVSLIIPFLGRTAIGWIVDVTTIGATVVYGPIAAATLSIARREDCDLERFTGAAGLIAMIFFGICLLLPNFLFSHGLEAESYFLFTTWGILGFLAFRYILRNDPNERFGKSMIIWIGLLSLVVFFSFTWMSQSVISITNGTIDTVRQHYIERVETAPQNLENAVELDEQFVEKEMQQMEIGIEHSIFIAAILFGIALALLLSNYSYMATWARRSERELDVVKDIALTDSLTDVKSHHAYQQTEKAISDEIASGSEEPFAVVVCDLNGLKEMNDSQGHEAGDDYIKEGCGLICETFSHSPVYRVGGDEFAVVLKGVDYENRKQLVSSFQEMAKANLENGGVVVASGIADFIPGTDRDMRRVFDRADFHMYDNKHALKGEGAAEQRN